MKLLERIFGSRKPAPSTGRTFLRSELQVLTGSFCHYSDESYAEVSSAWLKSFYDDYRKVLFDQGVTKWEPTFDCDNFATFFVALANVRFFSVARKSFVTAQSLAMAEFWYRPGCGPDAHAIVTVLTERGQIFIEPQSGQQVTLTAEERATCLLFKF